MTVARGPGGARGPYRFVPWSVPVALGLVAGVALAAPLEGWTRLAAALGLLGGAAASWRWRAGARPRVGGVFAAGWLPFVPLALLAGAVGVGRLHAWEHGPSERARRALALEWAGEEREWRGRSDGEVLHVEAPLRARLALVTPRGASPPVGELVVVGTAEPADVKRNPGGFDASAHLARRGVAGRLFVRRVDVVRAGRTAAGRLAAGVSAGLGERAAALMLAMTLGRRDDLADLRDSFGAAGMAHLLALSGLHVGVLLVAAGRLLRGLRRGRAPLLAALTVAFVLLVGPSPSVVRAATMALAAVASAAMGGGRVDAWAALGLAALVGTLGAPQMVFDLGFQLSYLAVVGMLLFIPPWTSRLAGLGVPPPGRAAPGPAAPGGSPARLLGWAATGAVASTAAQLPTVSLVAGTFQAVPLLSPLVNVVAVPVAALLVPLGFLAGLVGLVSDQAARLVNLAVAPLTSVLIGTAELGAALPALGWGEVTPVGHAAWAGFTLAVAAWSWRRLRLRRLLLVALTLAGLTSLLPPAHAAPDIWFLDVGQGDATLVRLGGGAAVLVDGGGSPFSDFDVGRRVVIPALRALGVTRLAAVIVTHADADHAEGLVPVLEKFRVGLLVTGPPDPDAALDTRLRELALARGVPVHEARRGERLLVGAASLDVVNPAPHQDHGGGNDASVAFVLRYRGEARALFLGDLGVSVEPDLAVPPVDVLKVGHHGSRGSTGPELVRAASPRLAVISVGRNGYGHPAVAVTDRLAAHGAEVITTLKHGAVRVPLAGPLTWHGTASPARRERRTPRPARVGGDVIDCSQCS